jgi:major membrane immunogen (membrane-anchored lipoprotein)
MMNLAKPLLLILSLLLLSACDAIDDFSHMNEKQGRVQALIKEKYGWHAQVGWNIHNAELTQVTLVLSAEEVANERVATLQSIAQETVRQVFSSTPKAIYVTLVSEATEN